MIEVSFPPRGRVFVLSSVHGLAAEAERVRDAFDRVDSIGVVALGVSPEGVTGLQHVLQEQAEGVARDAEEAAEDLAEADVGYGFALHKFGKVLLPPRCLLEGVRLARERDVPVEGVDVSEAEYERVFTQHVGAIALMRYSRRARKLTQAPPGAATAREFAIAWDRALTSIGGYADVERARERHMAEHARRLAAEHGTVLLLVEAAREEGVVAALRAHASS